MTGTALLTEGGRIRLKWHRLRDAADRASHDRASLAEGLARGALLEVDLQLTGDSHWVCLHDATLEAETTGRGPVAGASRRAIEGLRQRHQHGRALPDPPLFLDELAERLAASTTGARLQLDLKLDRRALDGPARARFAAAVAPLAERFDLGGEDWPLVQELAALAPGILPGFETWPLALGGRLADRGAAERFAEAMVEAAPEAAILYIHYRLIPEAASFGVDLVGTAHGHGHEVDAWTIDPGLEGLDGLLRHLAEAGCDQITTNAPLALEAIWQRSS